MSPNPSTAETSAPVPPQVPITDFRGEHRWLSNFHLCEILYDGFLYASTEHAYQAAKSMDVEHRWALSVHSGHNFTCTQAKHHGKRIKLRPQWDDIRVAIMTTIIREKFIYNGPLGMLLLQTGDRMLIEGNTWGDTFWGVCNGKGENQLGKVLMQTRSLLRTIIKTGSTAT